jgi:hypothetical protein
MSTIAISAISAIADKGKVRLGAGFRTAALRPSQPVVVSAPTVTSAPAAVADARKVRLGAGFRRA